MALREQIIFHAKVATFNRIREMKEYISADKPVLAKYGELLRQLRMPEFDIYTHKITPNTLLNAGLPTIERVNYFLDKKQHALWDNRRAGMSYLDS